MSTWYEAYPYGDYITPVEVERSTESSVWINGQIRRRISLSGYGYFRTPEEAKACIVQNFADKLENARSNVEFREKDMAKAQAIALPGVTP